MYMHMCGWYIVIVGQVKCAPRGWAAHTIFTGHQGISNIYIYIYIYIHISIYNNFGNKMKDVDNVEM